MFGVLSRPCVLYCLRASFCLAWLLFFNHCMRIIVPHSLSEVMLCRWEPEPGCASSVPSWSGAELRRVHKRTQQLPSRGLPVRTHLPAERHAQL